VPEGSPLRVSRQELGALCVIAMQRITIEFDCLRLLVFLEVLWRRVGPASSALGQVRFLCANPSSLKGVPSSVAYNTYKLVKKA